MGSLEACYIIIPKGIYVCSVGGKEGRRLVKLEQIIDAMSTKSTFYSTAVSIISDIDAHYLIFGCNVRFIIILKMKSEGYCWWRSQGRRI